MGLLDKKEKIYLIQALVFVLSFFSIFAKAQSPAVVQAQTTSAESTAPPEQIEEVDEGGGTIIKNLNGQPNSRRIRRHLSLVAGVKKDEEFLIPSIPLNYKGSTELIEIQRIKGSDMFRILPTKVGNGIITVHNKKTGQILIELRVDIRDQSVEKNLREIQALLADIEGIEYKIVNSKILLDGFVLLPKDLIRIGNVVKQFGPEAVKSLVTLSPLARKKIVEYIAKDINNPEVSVTAIGDFIKLEGVVNSAEEKQRISDIVSIYMPDIVTDKVEGLDNVEIKGRRIAGNAESFIINLITIRKQEDVVEPPPKMIQVVTHFVEFSDRYLKDFNFLFSPSLTGIGNAAAAPQAPTTIGEIANIVNNLLPKINWARTHGFIRILDTASVLTQDKFGANISRSVTINNGQTTVSSGTSTAGGTSAATPTAQSQANLMLDVTPIIKSEKSGLVELSLNVTTSPSAGSSISTGTSIKTKISVRDRQSAAFGGIISKKSANDYGGPSNVQNAIVSLNHGKKYEKSSGNFVVFVTPIIKSSASAGVDQIKKKFRMKE